MSGEILLWLVIGAWIVHDYMTWGPLSPQSWSWYKDKWHGITQEPEFRYTVHTSSTWAIDEREGVHHITGREQHTMSPWDRAA